MHTNQPFRLTWSTDIHLDQCSDDAFKVFIESICKEKPSALCLTGDLSEALRLEADLKRVAEAVEVPVYFVLGNHDYYHGSIAGVRKTMTSLTQNHPLLRWMPAAGALSLTPDTTLLGHGGWGDGGNGDVYNSWLRLQDFRKIEELKAANNHDDSLSIEVLKTRPLQQGLIDLLAELGKEGAGHFAPLIHKICQSKQSPHHLVLLVHAPPFKEACLYGTAIADDNWAAHFTCKAIGDLLEEVCDLYPQHQFTVLAGHTHNICDIQHKPNLRICVGTAEYGKPQIAQTFIL